MDAKNVIMDRNVSICVVRNAIPRVVIKFLVSVLHATMAIMVHIVIRPAVHFVNITFVISLLENVNMDVNRTGQETFVTNVMVHTLGRIVLRSATSTAKDRCAIILQELVLMDVKWDTSRRLAIKVVALIV
ncbi:uncharacterized protein LOC134251941 [Saccostrea cucullata]|uniref:uncharacterized protein LOC134251941 n=1 Tax=Saccostrea cuccullata TaxID=36930 RepID=UPI002ED267DD